MFDISWSELLIIGVVALIVVGPKELPVLLRTVGKYMGMVKRQAAEFRAQFDEAMRESEIDQLRKDVESIKSDAESSLREAESSFQREIDSARTELDAATKAAEAPHTDAHDANGLPIANEPERAAEPTPVAGAGAVAAAAAAQLEPAKSGA